MTKNFVIADETAKLPSFFMDRQFFKDHPDRHYYLRRSTIDELEHMGGPTPIGYPTYTVIKKAEHGRLKIAVTLKRHIPNTENNAHLIWNEAQGINEPEFNKLFDDLEGLLNKGPG